MKTEAFRVIIFVYVNDLIIIGSTLSGVTWVKAKLGSLFNMKDLGELRYYIGISLE